MADVAASVLAKLKTRPRLQHPNHRLYQNSADTFARYFIDIILYI